MKLVKWEGVLATMMRNQKQWCSAILFLYLTFIQPGKTQWGYKLILRGWPGRKAKQQHLHKILQTNTTYTQKTKCQHTQVSVSDTSVRYIWRSETVTPWSVSPVIVLVSTPLKVSPISPLIPWVLIPVQVHFVPQSYQRFSPCSCLVYFLVF